MKLKTLQFKFSLLLMTVFISSIGFSQSCPTDMIAYWRLQESGENVFADVKGIHDAYGATAVPVQTAGVKNESGKAQLFGSNAYIAVTSHSDFNWNAASSFSIELWVKFTDIATTGVFIGRDDATTDTHWWLGRTTEGKIMWYLRSNTNISVSITGNNAINDGNWHYVVAVRNGTENKIYLYVDNVLQNAGGTTFNITGGNLSSTADLSIGGLIENGTPKYFYNGSIDEVAIYNRALTTTELNSHYDNMRSYGIGYCDGNNPVLLSTPATYATVGKLYTYDVDASGNPLPTYSLQTAPVGMTINATTGVISWTPTSVTQNGHVVVEIESTLGTLEQSFNIFIATTPTCRANLTAYWDFNESGSTPYYDNIANFAMHGLNSGHSTGKIGNGVSFNGSSDSLNVWDELADPNNVFFDFKSSFSIELWMKSDATPSNVMVLVGRDMKRKAEPTNVTQYWLGVLPNGTVGLNYEDYSGTNSINFSSDPADGTVLDGSWHHIVNTYDATANSMKLYIDNVLVGEGTQSFVDFGGYTELNIGHLNTSLDKFWYEGMIDELAFYNTALSATEVTSNYTAGNNGEGACMYNYAPVIVTTPGTTVNEDAAYTYTIKATDAFENDITTISVVTKPAWLTGFSYIPGDTLATISGTPGNPDVGNHNVTLRVSDGSINIDQSFVIEVINVNDPPSFTSTPLAVVNEDAAYSYTVAATDIDASTVLTYSAPVLPDWMEFDAATKILSGTPTNDEVGIFDVTLRVNDGNVDVDQQFTVTVNNVNDLPVVTSSPILTVKADQAYMYEIVATDVDEGDVLTYSADASLPSWLTFTSGANSGILSGTPTATHVGSHAIILKVSDGHGEIMQGFTITVSPASAINDIDNSIIGRIFPNPVTNDINFEFAKSGKIRVDILDVTGNIKKQTEAENTNILNVNISDLANGIYIYKVYQEGKVGIGKFVKE